GLSHALLHRIGPARDVCQRLAGLQYLRDSLRGPRLDSKRGNLADCLMSIVAPGKGGKCGGKKNACREQDGNKFFHVCALLRSSGSTKRKITDQFVECRTKSVK